MPRFSETSVVIHDCTIVWDGLNRPEQDNQGAPKYVLKVVINPSNPDLAEFNQIAQEALQTSKFNGVLPQGGRMPVGTAGPAEFGGMFPGFGVISAKTKFMPAVHAEDNSILDPMQWAAQIYPGQKVNVLVDCYEYDAMGNKGIGCGLQGVQLLTSQNAQRLALGGGGADTTAAFGGPQAQPAQPGPYAPQGAQPGMPAQPQPGQPGGAPGGQPLGQPQYSPPAGPVAPGQPAPGVPPQTQGYIQPGAPTAQPLPGQPTTAQPGQPPATSGYAQPVNQPGVATQPGGAAPATGYPQQAQNFLPPQT